MENRQKPENEQKRLKMQKKPDLIGGYPISFRSFGMLAYSGGTGTPIHGHELMRLGAEGKDATYTSLRELRKHGLTEHKLINIDGKPRRETTITHKGHMLLKELGVNPLGRKQIKTIILE